MCLAVPAKVTAREDFLATVEVSGVTRQVSVMLLPEAKVGDYVLIHAGFAIQTIDEEGAREMMELYKEIEKHESEQPA